MWRTLSVFLFVFFLLGCLGGGEGLKYFESVYQDPGCTEGLCFDEVMAVEDGFVYLKMGNSTHYWTGFCSAGAGNLSRLFSSLDGGMGENVLSECTGCAAIHLFYNDGGRTRVISAPKGERVFADGFHGKAKGICSGQLDGGVIHIIYGKGGEYFDYHIFSNNVVVYERFGLRDGELLGSKAYRISGERFMELKSKITEDFYASETTDSCPKDGLFYGYVEAAFAGRHRDYFTCGGETPAGAAFSALVAEAEGGI
jgi:hypothetical protein